MTSICRLRGEATTAITWIANDAARSTVEGFFPCQRVTVELLLARISMKESGEAETRIASLFGHLTMAG